MAGWTWLASRVAYSRLLVAAVAIGAGGATMLYACGPETPASLFIAGGIALGLASAGVQVGAFSLLADVIVRFRRQDGAAAEGLMTGVWVAGEKLGLAFGPVLCGLILAAGGFVSGADRSVQTPEAIQAARVAMTLAPGLVIAAGGALLWIGRRRIDRQAGD
jgi:Na+/melibiose symporter-like transporter